MDIKAGFNNIPMSDDCKQFCGLVTQDGLFVYNRMTFGFTAAPCHFQFVMETALAGPRGSTRPRHATYLDDVHIAG